MIWIGAFTAAAFVGQYFFIGWCAKTPGTIMYAMKQDWDWANSYDDNPIPPSQRTSASQPPQPEPRGD